MSPSAPTAAPTYYELSPNRLVPKDGALEVADGVWELDGVSDAHQGANCVNAELASMYPHLEAANGGICTAAYVGLDPTYNPGEKSFSVSVWFFIDEDARPHNRTVSTQRTHPILGNNQFDAFLGYRPLDTTFVHYRQWSGSEVQEWQHEAKAGMWHFAALVHDEGAEPRCRHILVRGTIADMGAAGNSVQ